jgi:phosphohistidine swiveling domain-containing protein
MKSTGVPAGYLLEYLQAGGLAERMALLAGQSLSAPPSLERVLDLNLELSLLLATSPVPDRLQEKLLRSLDGLGSRLVIIAKGPGCSPSGMEMGTASTRAEALELILAGWARAWSPSALLAGQFPFASADRYMDALPVIEVVEVDGTGIAAGAENLVTGRGLKILSGQDVEFLPDGSVVLLDAGRLMAALDRAEAELPGAEPQAAPATQDLANWIRYSFGLRYNAWTLPDDAFAFMELLLPACHRRAATPGSHDMSMDHANPVDHGTEGFPAGLVSELPDEVVELWRLALRATSLQLALPPAPVLAYQPAAGGILPQQLTGLAAAPGRVSGRVSRSGAQPHIQTVPSSGVVCICERLSLPLMAAMPASVLERSGSRIGLGALLARDSGIPCISGIGDLAMLPDGLPVLVDGFLGLVTINRLASTIQAGA